MDSKSLIELGLFTAEPRTGAREPKYTPSLLAKPGTIPFRSPPKTGVQPSRTRVSTQTIHSQRCIGLLRLLFQYGHVRTAEVAAALYPSARYARQLAQRLIRTASNAGDVLLRKNTLGTISVVLSEGGAAKLELTGLPARHGRDIVGVAGATFLHRTLATNYLLHRAKSALAFGEYAIHHGQAPIDRQSLIKRFAKIPDGIICYSTDLGPVVDILEVEQSAKPMSELVNLLRWAEVVGSPLSGPGSARVQRLVIAFDASQGHASRLLKAASMRWGHCGHAEQQEAMRRVVLASISLGPGFSWKGCEERTLASLSKRGV